MKNFCMTVEMDPKGDKITCPAFGMYSCPAEYSTMGHIVLDLTSLAYQPKLSERYTHPKRHVTLLCRRKNQHIQLTHENWTKMKMINLLFCQTALPTLKTKMISLWCNLHQEKNRWKKSVNLLQNAEFPTEVRKRKGPPVWQDPSTSLEQHVSSEEVSTWGKNPNGEALRSIENQLSDKRNS